ncbi:MAG: tRNA (adenosine(37)-N6)-threonylcarbamoyltransferase complex transferase subunit TsaD [Patescibacteria group bacterium]
MKILAIETSCDETAASIVEEDNFRPVVLSEAVASQMAIHAESGGVIPNVAARLHVENLPAVLKKATDSQRLDYDAVAVTVGPGLIGSLLVGVAAAKTIAMAKDLPFFAVNHMAGHVYSAWLAPSETGDSKLETGLPQLPALFVIVSGGHTELVLMERHYRFQLLGATRDDAAGEAFDKVARMLGLPYPGGPAISELARHGRSDAIDFPIGLNERDNLDFSFSGLKGAVFHEIQKHPAPLSEHLRADIAASFQDTVARTISRKTVAALQSNPEVRSVCLVGGVAANKHLRVELEKAVKNARGDVQFHLAPLQYCTDNAAMIGAAAIFKHLFSKPDDWSLVEANPNFEL